MPRKTRKKSPSCANWQDTHTVVESNSALWASNVDFEVRSLSSDWVGGNVAYTNIAANSASYLSAVDLSFLSVSSNWDSVYSSVFNTSANWNSVYSNVQSNSSSYATTSFIENNFLPLSGGTVSGVLKSGTGSSITLLVSTNKIGINNEIPNEALTVTGNISSDSIIYDNAGNSNQWNSVYTTINANSASYATSSFVHSSFVHLSGNTLTGALVAPSLCATNLHGDGSDVVNINAFNIASGTLSASILPAFSGDIASTATNGSLSAKVVAIQNNPISVQSPSNGQVLQWNGTVWSPGALPSGGSGGGGLSYYFNFGTEAQSPTTNLSSTPNTPKELGVVGTVAGSSYTLNNVSTTNYDLICGFVSLTGNPNTTQIPAGLWDFNIWASSNATTTNQMILRLYVYRYDGSAYPTLLASSDDFSMYDPSVTAPYTISVVLPQTTISASNRIYIELRAKSTQNGKNVTVYFGDATPSHVHTTLPSVGGSGLVKVINGVYQNPASLLVNSDVASNAQIDQSKINGLLDIASKTNTTYSTVQTNSATSWNNALANQYSDSKFLPLSGGTVTNNLTVAGSISATGNVTANNARVITSSPSDALPIYMIRTLTQTQYNALSVPDPNTLYIVTA